MSSRLAKFSKQHEEKRFQAWKTALESFWPWHYEDPAAELTAPTCSELRAKLAALLQKALAEWETSTEGYWMIERLKEIGKEKVRVRPESQRFASPAPAQ